jgi:ribosomal protein L37AE/L43A
MDEPKVEEQSKPKKECPDCGKMFTPRTEYDVFCSSRCSYDMRKQLERR